VAIVSSTSVNKLEAGTGIQLEVIRDGLIRVSSTVESGGGGDTLVAGDNITLDTSVPGQVTIAADDPDTLAAGNGIELDTSTPGVVSIAAAPSWVMQTADRTLTSTTAVQKLFDTTANGRLTLPTGVYEFSAFIYLEDMSGTPGNFALDLLGAGTATLDRISYSAYGVDNITPLIAANRGGSASVTALSAASIVNGLSGTGVVATIHGMFRVSAAGTIIPSIALVTAAAATVKAGTWFRVRRVGASAQTSNGSWD
jgi:hypothetical protein